MVDAPEPASVGTCVPQEYTEEVSSPNQAEGANEQGGEDDIVVTTTVEEPRIIGKDTYLKQEVIENLEVSQ